jgi:hypothetical protein
MVEPWTYTLDENERDIIIRTAEGRHANARKKKVKDRQIGKRDPMQVDREGMAGEVVFGALANMFVDFRTHSGIPKHDFLARDGRTIDIKTTRHPNGYLLVPISKGKNPCDWYGLVTCDWSDPDVCPTGKFVGGVHRMGIITPQTVVNLGHGDGYGVKGDKLLPPDEFMALVGCGPSGSDTQT